MTHRSHRDPQEKAVPFARSALADSLEQRLTAPRELPLSELSLAVANIRSASLVEYLAALQLVPENAFHRFSLEVAAHCAVAIPASRRERLSRRELRAFVRVGIPEHIRLEDDPPEQSFTVPLAFFDGNHVLLSGRMDGQLPLLRDVLRALYHSSADSLRSLRERLIRPLRGLLLIADALSSRAGLSRYCLPPETRPRAIVVPDEPELERLRTAARIPVEEIKSLLGSRGLALEDVAPFRQRTSQSVLARGAPPSFLLERPLFIRDEVVVLPVPGAVARALLGFIWREANRAQVADDLLHRVCNVQISDAEDSFRALFPEARALPAHPLGAPLARSATEIIGQVESDRFAYFLHVIPHSDEVEALGPRFAQRAQEVSRELRELRPELREGFAVLLTSARGDEEWTKPLRFKVPDDVPSFAFDVHDLATLATVGDQNSSLVTKAFSIYERIASELAIPPFSFLDVVHAYVKGPKEVAEALSNGVQTWIAPGGGGRLRMEADVALDRHVVVGRLPNSWVEVERLYRRSRLGIYRRRGVEGLELWVEAGSPARGVWVVCEDARVDEQDPLWRTCDAIAFWTWRFVQSGAMNSRSPITTVELRPGTPEGAGEFGLRIEPLSESRFEAHVGTFPPEKGHYSEDPDALVLRELSKVFGTQPDVALASLRSGSEHRRIIIRSFGEDPTLDARGIPFAPIVHDYDLNWTTARAAAKERRSGLKGKAALDAQVSSLFSELTRLLSELQSDDALLGLVLANEAIIQRRAATAHSISGRRSDPDLSPDLFEEVAEDEMSVTRSGPSARFVIEILAAKDPIGRRRITQSVVDEALCLAAAIIQIGAESDAIHFGVELRGPDATSHSFVTDLTEATLKTFLTSMQGRVTSSDDQGDRLSAPLSAAELAAVARAEFGFSLEDYGRLVGIILDRSVEVRPEPHWISLGELARLAAVAGLSGDRVGALIRGLSLIERPDFLKPPAPFRKQDVLPWRLNRELSFIRRPLILRGDGREARILTGHRHLALAAQHLSRRVVSAQLTAHSTEMRAFVTRRQSELSRDFVRDVAARLMSVGCIVRTNLKKVGGLRVTDDAGMDLGDFDVVALLPSRRQVLLLECKRVALARSPFELAQSWRNFIGTPEAPGEFLSKVKRREEWALRHSDAFQREFERNLAGGFPTLSFTSRIVVEREFILSFFPDAAARITWVSVLVEAIRRGEFG